MTFHPYESCRSDAGRPQPGTTGLQRWLLAEFAYASNMGIYNYRPIAGTSTLSQHACGKAGDTGIPTLSTGRANTALGNPVVLLLIEHAWELGIMGIIYNRIRYDRGDPRGAYYGGVHPHYDHIHWEQTAARAASLDYNDVVAILGPPEGSHDVAALQVIDLQKALNLAGQKDYEGKALTEDDIYGPRTESALVKGLAAGGSVDLSNYFNKTQSDARYINVGEAVKITK